MRKDNRKVLSPSGLCLICNARSTPILSFSGLTREPSQTNLPCLSLDPRVKPEGDSRKIVPEGDGSGDESVPEGDSVWWVDSRIKSENDSGGNENGCGWKRSGGAAAVAAISVVFCLGVSEVKAQCAVPPTCESLGYNKTVVQCSGTEILKCPFDTSKVFCNPDYTANAKIGDIYYSDGTISDSVIAGKTPVGIIAYVNGKRGFAIALEEKKLQWSENYNNLSCLPDLDSAGASGDMNGVQNTQCIMSQTNDTYPAAAYCNGYAAVSTGKGSKGWYLPAAGELRSLSYSYGAINLVLSKLSKKQLSSYDYWSSSEYNYYNGIGAWVVSPSDGTMHRGSGKGFNSNSLRVRCVLAF